MKIPSHLWLTAAFEGDVLNHVEVFVDEAAAKYWAIDYLPRTLRPDDEENLEEFIGLELPELREYEHPDDFEEALVMVAEEGRFDARSDASGWMIANGSLGGGRMRPNWEDLLIVRRLKVQPPSAGAVADTVWAVVAHADLMDRDLPWLSLHQSEEGADETMFSHIEDLMPEDDKDMIDGLHPGMTTEETLKQIERSLRYTNERPDREVFAFKHTIYDWSGVKRVEIQAPHNSERQIEVHRLKVK